MSEHDISWGNKSSQIANHVDYWSNLNSQYVQNIYIMCDIDLSSCCWISLIYIFLLYHLLHIKSTVISMIKITKTSQGKSQYRQSLTSTHRSPYLTTGLEFLVWLIIDSQVRKKKCKNVRFATSLLFIILGTLSLIFSNGAQFPVSFHVHKSFRLLIIHVGLWLELGSILSFAIVQVIP